MGVGGAKAGDGDAPVGARGDGVGVGDGGRPGSEARRARLGQLDAGHLAGAAEGDVEGAAHHGGGARVGAPGQGDALALARAVRREEGHRRALAADHREPSIEQGDRAGPSGGVEALDEAEVGSGLPLEHGQSVGVLADHRDAPLARQDHDRRAVARGVGGGAGDRDQRAVGPGGARGVGDRQHRPVATGARVLVRGDGAPGGLGLGAPVAEVPAVGDGPGGGRAVQSDRLADEPAQVIPRVRDQRRRSAVGRRGVGCRWRGPASPHETEQQERDPRSPHVSRPRS